MDLGDGGPDNAAPLSVLGALGTSASARHTFRELALTAAPLTEATAAAAVAALAAHRASTTRRCRSLMRRTRSATGRA